MNSFGRLILILVLILGGVRVLGAEASADEITLDLASDIWCPYTCAEGERPGFLVELLRLAMKGHPVRVEYRVVNWARAKRDAEDGVYDAIGGANYGDAPNFIFPKVSQVDLDYEIFVKAASSWKYKGTFKGRKVGVINGYSYDDATNALIATKAHEFFVVSGERGLDSLIPMLNSGRIDGIIESKAVFQEAIKKRKFKLSDYKSLGKTRSGVIPHYIAFSPSSKNRDQLIEWLIEGQRRLAKSGELKKLKAKYGID